MGHSAGLSQGLPVSLQSTALPAILILIAHTYCCFVFWFVLALLPMFCFVWGGFGLVLFLLEALLCESLFAQTGLSYPLT